MPNCKNCMSHVSYPNRETTCASCNGVLHKECSIKQGEYSLCDVCYASGETMEEKVVINIPDTIRRSYIELYRKCPYSFYLDVIKGFSQPPNVYTQLGIDLHELFDKASWNKELTDIKMTKMFIKIFNDYPDTFFDSDEFKTKMYVRGLTCIKTFFEHLPTFPKTPYATEQTIKFSIHPDLPDVQITMDRIDLVDGMLEITDYKTGAVIVGKKISTELQVPLYIYAIQKHYDLPVRKFTLYYLNEDKTRTFFRVDEYNFACTVKKRVYDVDLREAINETKRVFTNIQAGKFNVPNDYHRMFFQCKTCHHKIEQRCKGAEEQVWLQKGS